MPSAHIVVSCPIVETPRTAQVRGMFDLPFAEKSEISWEVNLPLADQDWHIGLIVGPSGCGKSTIVSKLFAEHVTGVFSWPKDKSVLEGFPEAPIKDIVHLLSSVGFSSPPSWLRPFTVLSTGEQFRVTMARILAEPSEIAVVDEFTSVVDRTVAQIGSCAIAKAVRARKRKLIAVTCHEDIEQWLDPDWVYRPAQRQFAWRQLRRRPDIALSIFRADKSIWVMFKHHHYLNTNLHKAARCFVAEYQGRPAAFASVLFWPHPHKSAWREHRTVCLPDFQGVGIGNALSEFVASVFAATGKRYCSTTSHPAMIRHRLHSPLWKLLRSPRLGRNDKVSTAWKRCIATTRLTAGFEYIGPSRPEKVAEFGLRYYGNPRQQKR